MTAASFRGVARLQAPPAALSELKLPKPRCPCALGSMPVIRKAPQRKKAEIACGFNGIR